MQDPEGVINKLQTEIGLLELKKGKKYGKALKDELGLELAFDWVLNELAKVDILRVTNGNGGYLSTEELRNRLAYIAYACVCLDINLKTYVKRLG